jgi:hypothetical protein
MLLLLFNSVAAAGRRVLARLVLRRAPAGQVTASAVLEADLRSQRAGLARMTVAPATLGGLNSGAAIRARITAGRAP